jgi:hypothetical protein
MPRSWSVRSQEVRKRRSTAIGLRHAELVEDG